MIYSDSRYASGTVVKAQDARNSNYRLAVYRKFPTASSKYYSYTWVEGDRIDLVSFKLLGSASLWWKIMDFNPEVIDPFSIPVGTTIRVPSV